MAKRATRAEIEELRDAAAAAKSEAESALTKAKAALAAAQLYAQTVEEKAGTATQAMSNIEGLAEGASECVDEITALRNQVAPKAKQIDDFAEKLQQLKSELSSHRMEMSKAKERAEEIHNTVERALPGATSAGLAQAFQTRKDSYRLPKLIWALVFVLTTALLALLSIWNPLGNNSGIGTWQEFLAHLLARLPFAAPLVWLGIYAAARHGQALRLEEEYAHKEAISRSFEGYKKQLVELEAQSEDLHGTVELVNRVIAALSLHPGRIYDGAKDPLSPLEALSAKLDEVVRALTEKPPQRFMGDPDAG